MLAAEELFLSNVHLVRGWIRYFLSSSTFQADRDDVFQECYVKIQDRLVRPEKPLAWLKAVCASVSIDHLRRLRPVTDLTELDLPDSSRLDDVIYAELICQELGRDLSPRDYQLLILRYVYGYSATEVSRELGMASSEAVNTAASRARAHARQLLKDK